MRSRGGLAQPGTEAVFAIRKQNLEPSRLPERKQVDCPEWVRVRNERPIRVSQPVGSTAGWSK